MPSRLLQFTSAVMLMAATPASAGTVCKVLSGLLADTGCQAGDNVRMSLISERELPDAILDFCDMTSQVITLPDSAMPALGDERNYVVLCRFHQN
ncbi:MAG: hypothetical protein EOQ98_30385 [Mesorhizobium sp.]|nr:hypothetical protein [Mesorhizobium sp.]RWO94575.1 MAG: hypothetical protein EOQ98_30385 [Mesorhizobium sp.]TIM51236.1 MAG: hypothetical protein E5Y69_06645 [Mesorhizobium sp.]